ncbi:MAG: hypothetical protein K2I22_04555 [Lachnospiraceae bacterium]|nr:hypothetical protein [Lachnospiraceae bacterium]
MRRKRNKKGYLAVAALMAVATLWMLPIKAEADCGEGTPTGKVGGYCATPICHTGNRTYFVQREYVRTCTNELGTKYEDYYVETTDNGCCPYN